MIDFLLGILAGIVTSIIIYVSRHYFAFVSNIFFSRYYATLSGEYNMYHYETDAHAELAGDNLEDDDEDLPLTTDNAGMIAWLREDEKNRVLLYRITLKQFAHTLRGELRTIENGNVIDREKLSGRITMSRIVIIRAEGKDAEHHNFGTLLLKITSQTSILRGAQNFLCANCGNVGSAFVFLEKIKN